MPQRGALTLLVLSIVIHFRANFSQPPDIDLPPMRQSFLLQTYIEYEWWLLAWADNSLACKFALDADGIPGLAEIQNVCPAEVYRLWLEQPACSPAASGLDASSCKGYYLYYAGSHSAERETVVELPPASASVNLTGCNQSNYEIICPLLPILSIQGIEPLPDYAITQVNFQIDAPPNFQDESGACAGSNCEAPLSLTSVAGERITFWVDSSFGDSSEKVEALYRVKPTVGGQWEI
jgi:hypothetical protein